MIWNQELEKLGAPQTESHDTSAAVEIAVEAIKQMIRRDQQK